MAAPEPAVRFLLRVSQKFWLLFFCIQVTEDKVQEETAEVVYKGMYFFFQSQVMPKITHGVSIFCVGNIVFLAIFSTFLAIYPQLHPHESHLIFGSNCLTKFPSKKAQKIIKNRNQFS